MVLYCTERTSILKNEKFAYIVQFFKLRDLFAKRTGIQFALYARITSIRYPRVASIFLNEPSRHQIYVYKSHGNKYRK